MALLVDIIRKTVGAQVCGTEYTPDGTLSEEELKKLYQVASMQDIAHIVGAELEAKGLLKDDEIAKKFRHQRMVAMFRYMRIEHALGEICRVLEEEKIAHIPLKGAIMRGYYPEPWMRTSADIDVLVRMEDLDRATDALVQKLNYRNDGINVHDVQMFAPSGVHLELHFDTVEAGRAKNSNAILSHIWDYAVPTDGCAYRCLLSDDIFYFYHIAHMAKHFEESGCGFRYFLDLWLLNHKKEFDRLAREALLREGGLLTFERAATELSEVWFSEKEHTPLSKQMERYVFEGGLYGTSDHTTVVQQIRSGRFRYIFRTIFLPYQAMKRRFPIVKKYPILYPFSHFARWIQLIKRRGVKGNTDMLQHQLDLSKTHAPQISDLLGELELEVKPEEKLGKPKIKQK